PNLGFVGTDMFTYRLCSTVCPTECGEAIVVIRVGNEDDCFVPTLFTPNGDGVNDELIVPCLETERFPENELIVFNEWGDVVYKASPYLNDWRGESSGNPLPVGTYFYIMDFGDGSQPKHTFLVLER
ncbi:MAG: gliding motility-associated C-terminal domain-containing protein, partial [Saprospiraceae bacterium]